MYMSLILRKKHQVHQIIEQFEWHSAANVERNLADDQLWLNPLLCGLQVVSTLFYITAQGEFNIAVLPWFYQKTTVVIRVIFKKSSRG